ncbi:MAG: hypothetical protein JXA37_13295 [Chloroflexia bacterium]|nr:hypothetical protein [Chloroflexia bacterium]
MSESALYVPGRAAHEIERENQALKRSIYELGGIFNEMPGDDPYVLNQFLRYVLDFERMEQGAKRPLRSIFSPEFVFPALERLPPAQLQLKLEEIERILWEHRIFIDLVEDLPLEQVYAYIVDHVLAEEIPVEFPEGLNLHFTGCSGCCSDCFQLAYCEVGQEACLGVES